MGSPSEARTISVIVICPSTWLRVVGLSNHLIFDICDLEFLVTSAGYRKRGKTIRVPSWGSEKLEPLDLDSFLEIGILLFICIVYIVLIVEIVEAKLAFPENTADLLWLF